MPNTNESAPKPTNGEQETNDDANGIGFIYKVVFKGKASAWTALFTCVLAVFSYLLYQVSNAANQTSQATQAASLSSFGPAVVKVPNPDGKTLKGYNVFFQWMNNGTTPSRTTFMQSNAEVGAILPTKDLDFNNLQQSQILTAVLGPKAGIQVAPNFVSLEDLEDVSQGRKHMFLWGWAVYHDIFSKSPRLSEYCFVIQNVTWSKPNHADFTGDITITDPPCGVHFCFNEECEDYQSRTK